MPVVVIHGAHDGNDIPFVIIRAISDKADHSAEVNFSEFVEKASLHSSNMLEKIIQEI